MMAGSSLNEGSVTQAADRTPRRNWLGWLLAAGILVGCFWFVDLREVLGVLQRLTPVSFALLIGLHTADRLLMGYKWGLLLRILDVPLTAWQAMRIFYQGNFSGAFMPSHVGGDILRIVWVREATGVTHAAVASVVMERLLGMLCAVNWAIIGGGIYAAFQWPESTWALTIGSVIGMVVANTLFAMSLSARTHGKILGWLGRLGGSRLAGALHRFYETYAEFGRDRSALLLNALLTFLQHFLRIVLVWAAALALGLDLPTLSFIAATAIYLAIMRFPIAPDGWGVGELTAIGIYGGLGVPAADALVLSLLGHVLPVLALLPGFFFLLRGRPNARASS